MGFDTLGYLEMLKASGVTDEQCKAQVRALSIALESQDFVTKTDILELKTDISNLKTELKTDISELKTELKTDISDLKTELKGDISDLKTDMLELKVELIKWMIGMGFSIVSIMFVLLRFMLPS